MLHRETVTPELLHVLSVLLSIPELNSFRLVGGTAIALQMGHRKSLDIDLFSNERIGRLNLKNALTDQFPNAVFSITEHNILAEIQQVRVELYDARSTPFRKEPLIEDGMRLAALEDLTAFKLSTITARREKKDYIDLFFLFEKLGDTTPLEEFKMYEPLLSPKSLLFALSEVGEARRNKSPMPQMLIDINWEMIEQRMVEAARKYISQIETEKGPTR